MRQAANTGLAKAQYALGQMYLAGHGVTPNRPDAEVWLRRAAGQGYDKARELLAKLATAPEAPAPPTGWAANITADEPNSGSQRSRLCL